MKKAINRLKISTKETLKRLATGIPIALKSIAVLIPLALIGAGTWMIYQPAALIVVGIMIWIEIPRSDKE